MCSRRAWKLVGDHDKVLLKEGNGEKDVPPPYGEPRTVAELRYSVTGALHRDVEAMRLAGSPDLYLLDPITAGLRRLTSDAGVEVRPRWSRGGRWIYFWALPEGDRRPGIWKTSSAGGEAVEVLTTGVMTTEESPDRRSLYVTRFHQPALQLWRVPLDGGQDTLLADDVAASQNFVVGNRAVYFLAVGPGGELTERRTRVRPSVDSRGAVRWSGHDDRTVSRASHVSIAAIASSVVPRRRGRRRGRSAPYL